MKTIKISMIETLENRALFSATIVSTDGAQLVADLSIVRTELRAAVTTYHTDASTLSADVKALPKSKTNTADLNAIKKMQATALASENKDVAKLLAVVKGRVKQGAAAYLAYSNKPSTTNSARLQKFITSTSSLATPYLNKLVADLGTSGTKIDTALNKLVGDNPGDATLAGHVQVAETDQANTAITLEDGETTIQQDLATLVSDL